MNNQLAILNRMNQNKADVTLFILNTVLSVDTGVASSRETRAYRRMHINVIQAARATIREFTSRAGLFNVDHVAWQLDVMPEVEPIVPAGHECDPEDLMYQGQYVSQPGTAHMCVVCCQRWIKVSDQYTKVNIAA